MRLNTEDTNPRLSQPNWVVTEPSVSSICALSLRAQHPDGTRQTGCSCKNSGDAVGTAVGTSVGTSDGTCIGVSEGAGVGGCEGVYVGSKEGVSVVVGCSVDGSSVGVDVGTPLG